MPPVNCLLLSSDVSFLIRREEIILESLVIAHTDDSLEDDLTMAEKLEIIRSNGTSRPLWE
jgi:hypothetical protein